MWKHRQKLNNKHGFSLTELLVAILILSMVSSVVAGGIPVAKDAYEKVTLSANAQVMLSTAISALRNELCTASDVKVGSISDTGMFTEGTEGTLTAIKYYSPSIQNYSTLSIGAGDDNGSIILTQYADSTGKVSRRLVSSSAGDHQLYVTYTGVSYDKNNKIVIFTDLKVIDEGKEADTTPRAKLKNDDNKVEIRLIG